MSLEQIRTVIESFINDTHNSVLVIKGDWGVGKTYFWDALFAESRSQRVVGRANYSRVSVFGLNSLDELKSAIAISRIDIRANPKMDSLDASIGKLLTQLPKGSAVEKY